MKFQLLPIITFLYVALVGSHAALSPEAYWKLMLPNTPMPNAVKDLLHPGYVVDKGVVANNKKQVSVSVGGISVSAGPKGNPVYVGVAPGPIPFLYKYAATEDQLHDNPNVAIFFLQKDLNPGTQMTLHFTKSSQPVAFLSRTDAEKIPFSSKDLPKILDHFSAKPDSKEAGILEKAIKECEEPGIQGEEKYCATSLESMVDFSTSKLGKSVNAISTEVARETPPQKYSIVGVYEMAGDEAVVCHKQNYAFALFYCHKSLTTKAYMVSLVGADNTRARAVAVCHTDTSGWNPKHLAFQVLKVKPGTVPVCHFLPEDHIVWVPK